MSELLSELLSVDSEKARQFFLENLRDAVGSRRFREVEIEYVATVLAHFAQTSRFATGAIPVMANLSEIFDCFVLRTYRLTDADILEEGGSQILLFSGFFRDQMSRRHDVVWYDQIGQSFYRRASEYSKSQSRRKLLDCLSESFPMWTHTCSRMSRTLRQNQFLLKLG